MPHTHSLYRIRVWDLPTRIFHILLALCITGLIVSGEMGGDALRWHFWLGYAVLVLVLFRLIWGFLGGHWSRFVNFMPSPKSLFAYVRTLRRHEAASHIGHNPLGALSVLGMLSLVLIQVLSGFMTDDEIANAGPWVALVPSEWVSLASEYHGEVGKVLLILLVTLHVATVIYYKRIKGDDLITPMLTGDKVLTETAPESRDTFTSRLFALSVLLGCSYVVFRFVNVT